MLKVRLTSAESPRVCWGPTEWRIQPRTSGTCFLSKSGGVKSAWCASITTNISHGGRQSNASLPRAVARARYCGSGSSGTNDRLTLSRFHGGQHEAVRGLGVLVATLGKWCRNQRKGNAEVTTGPSPSTPSSGRRPVSDLEWETVGSRC